MRPSQHEPGRAAARLCGSAGGGDSGGSGAAGVGAIGVGTGSDERIVARGRAFGASGQNAIS
jgi:hypothetical protein